jgi:CHAD domain-containing protein
MRVGLRRLRAALSIFSEMLQDDESRHVTGELKWLTGELGPARGIDVFIRRVVQPLQAQHSHKDAVRALCQDVLRRRNDAYQRATDALASPRYRRLMLDVAGWIETGDCLMAGHELAAARRRRSARAFAAKELSQRRAKILKRGRKLRELEPAKRHELRIAAKKLRYGAEFFACLFPSGKSAKLPFLLALKELQDCLGALNDIVAHEELTARIAEEAASAGEPRRQLPFIAGIALGQEKSRIDPLLRTGLDQHRKFVKAKPFWR